MCYKKETTSLSRKQYLGISFPVLLVTYFCFYLVSEASANDLACSFVKYAYSAKGFDDNDVPRKAILGDHLRICEQDMTCCTEQMEYKLSNHSQAEFARLLKESITGLKNVFHSKTQQFDKFFQELLDKSQKDFHDMFSRTYGVLYEQNAFIFKSMFDELRKYYLSGGVDLTEALDGFFSRLYLKMFQVLNAQYTFDDYYLKCVEDQMDNLKPFGDVPRKLTTEIKRSFVATRTFVQALSVGRDIVRDVLEVRPSQECSRALMKMSYCPHCHGLPDLKPCGNYCLNVMKGCLAYHADLNSEWNSYIGVSVYSAFLTSEGNMATLYLFESCGKPRLQKRDVTGEIEFHTYNFGAQLAAFQPTKSGLERLVDDIKKKLKRTKNFWSQLASELCNNPEVAGDRNVRENSDSCWNGLAKARYDATPVGNGVSSQKDNPEVSLDITSQNVIISQQILTLHLINSKLNDAYNGLDVAWQDTADSEWDGSGSGSGSGNGWIIADENQHNFGDIYFSSSTPPVTEKPHELTTPPSSASQILNSFVVLITVLLVYVSATWW
ncbi:glypican-6-like [Limulus polyphemus]|uniref:Glypican-6-like n=1 Tax=Limulus polyphemus TaxID=6850 RepID=A0ABM1B5F3_LIMPO|nr:glypican-6-like [Limulus polyphemus]